MNGEPPKRDPVLAFIENDVAATREADGLTVCTHIGPAAARERLTWYLGLAEDGRSELLARCREIPVSGPWDGLLGPNVRAWLDSMDAAIDSFRRRQQAVATD